jgi:hypothetical protein
MSKTARTIASAAGWVDNPNAQVGRREVCAGNVHDRKDAALAMLDRLLGVQTCTKSQKIAALRDIEQAAKRMADQVERHMAQRSDK